jgi:hypothetical protein
MNSTAISLGWDCEPAAQGVERGLRTIKEHGYQTCPFDRMITNYLGIIDCIEDDFKYFCDPEYLRIFTMDRDYPYLGFKKGNRLIVNTKYNFIFNHESPYGGLYMSENWENGIEHYVLNNFKEFIERYSKRIQNFRNYIHDPNIYIHFIISKIGANQELEIVINTKYPNLKYDLVPIDETTTVHKIYNDIFNEARELMLTTIPSFF